MKYSLPQPAPLQKAGVNNQLVLRTLKTRYCRFLCIALLDSSIPLKEEALLGLKWNFEGPLLYPQGHQSRIRKRNLDMKSSLWPTTNTFGLHPDSLSVSIGGVTEFSYVAFIFQRGHGFQTQGEIASDGSWAQVSWKMNVFVCFLLLLQNHWDWVAHSKVYFSDLLWDLKKLKMGWLHQGWCPHALPYYMTGKQKEFMGREKTATISRVRKLPLWEEINFPQKWSFFPKTPSPWPCPPPPALLLWCQASGGCLLRKNHVENIFKP